jgi:hypothetical protein
MLQTNVQMGLLSQEKYAKDVGATLKYEQALFEELKKSYPTSNIHVKRVEERIKLMETELTSQPDEEEEEEEEESKEKPMVDDLKKGQAPEEVIQIHFVLSYFA